MLALTKIGAYKILAATKYWHRQNIGVDKILASTKYCRQQNIAFDRIHVPTECWRMRGSISLLFWPSRVRSS
jgi:hypothetical protein